MVNYFSKLVPTFVIISSSDLLAFVSLLKIIIPGSRNSKVNCHWKSLYLIRLFTAGKMKNLAVSLLGILKGLFITKVDTNKHANFIHNFYYLFKF